MQHLSRIVSVLLLSIGFELYLLQHDRIIPIVAAEDSCQELMIKYQHDYIMKIADCAEAMHQGKGQGIGISCILKCVLKMEQFLDEGGQIRFDAFEELMHKNFEEKYHKKINDTFLPCINGVKTLDDKDELCKDYDVIIRCVMNNVGQFCK